MVTERELRTTAQRCARACEQHHSTRDLLGWAQGLSFDNRWSLEQIREFSHRVVELLKGREQSFESHPSENAA